MTWEELSQWGASCLIFRERGKVSIGGVESLPRGNWSIPIHDESPTPSNNYGVSALSTMGTIHRYSLWQDKWSKICGESSFTGKIRPWKIFHLHRCSPTTWQACWLPGLDLDNQWLNTTTNTSFRRTQLEIWNSASNSWIPVLITLPIASQACTELAARVRMVVV